MRMHLLTRCHMFRYHHEIHPCHADVISPMVIIIFNRKTPFCLLRKPHHQYEDYTVSLYNTCPSCGGKRHIFEPVCSNCHHVDTSRYEAMKRDVGQHNEIDRLRNGNNITTGLTIGGVILGGYLISTNFDSILILLVIGIAAFVYFKNKKGQ